MKCIKLISLIAILNLTGVAFGAAIIDQRILVRLRANDPNLIELHHSSRRLRCDDTRVIVEALATNTNVEKIILFSNYIGNTGAKASSIL